MTGFGGQSFVLEAAGVYRGGRSYGDEYVGTWHWDAENSELLMVSETPAVSYQILDEDRQPMLTGCHDAEGLPQVKAKLQCARVTFPTGVSDIWTPLPIKPSSSCLRF